eukprot:13340813-Heterocapsa_arctica.AAC.1
MHRVLRTDPDLRDGELQSEGKGKAEKVGLSALPRKRRLSTSLCPEGKPRTERTKWESKCGRVSREKEA